MASSGTNTSSSTVPLEADHSVIHEILTDFIKSRGDVPFAVVMGDVDRVIERDLDGALAWIARNARILRACNLAYRQFGWSASDDTKQSSGWGFVVISDDPAILSERDLCSIVALFAARHQQSEFLFASPTDGVRVIAASVEPVLGTRVIAAKLGDVDDVRLSSWLSQWKACAIEFRAIHSGYDARTRQLMGWFTGWGVELCRTKMVRAGRQAVQIAGSMGRRL
jgi:hypothetical protein